MHIYTEKNENYNKKDYGEIERGRVPRGRMNCQPCKIVIGKQTDNTQRMPMNHNHCSAELLGHPGRQVLILPVGTGRQFPPSDHHHKAYGYDGLD